MEDDLPRPDPSNEPSAPSCKELKAQPTAWLKYSSSWTSLVTRPKQHIWMSLTELSTAATVTHVPRAIATIKEGDTRIDLEESPTEFRNSTGPDEVRSSEVKMVRRVMRMKKTPSALVKRRHRPQTRKMTVPHAPSLHFRYWRTALRKNTRR